MKSWNAGSTLRKRACATASMTGGDAFSLSDSCVKPCATSASTAAAAGDLISRKASPCLYRARRICPCFAFLAHSRWNPDQCAAARRKSFCRSRIRPTFQAILTASGGPGNVGDTSASLQRSWVVPEPSRHTAAL